VKPFSFNTTKSIINEAGSLQKIADICAQQHMSNPLVVTDNGIVKVGLMSKLETALKAGDMQYSSFTEVVADPPESVIYEALKVLKANKNDGVIGFGGGSSMDTAKLIALLAKSGGNAIEAYTSARLKNSYADMLAKEALRLLSNNIREATHNGKNSEARQAMLLGACLAGQAFANAPVAAVHALAYPLGGFYHIPHGLSNSLVLPHVMRFNINGAAEMYAELAPIIMGETVEGDAVTVAEKLIAYIEALISDLGLPNTLKEMKIAEGDLPMLAKNTIDNQQRLLINNPREVLEADALAIYEAAFLAGIVAAEVKHPAYYKAKNMFERITGQKQAPDRNALYYLEKASLYETDSRQDYDVVFIGDSLTDGADWQSFFKNYSVANRGINGDTSRGILKRIDNLTQTGAAHVFIMVGVNDINQGIELSEVIENYQAIVGQLLGTNTEVYVQSTLLTQNEATNALILSLNSSLKDFAASTTHVTFIDLNTKLAKNGKLNKQYTFDGIHLNGEGYRVWRSSIEPILNQR